MNIVMDKRDLVLQIVAEPVNQADLAAQQLAEAQQQLQQLQNVQQNTAALLSYELRTQFTTILGSTELLSTQLPGIVNEKQMRLLAEVNAASRRIFQTINVVMEYQLLQAGAMVLDIADVNALEICRTVLAGLAGDAAARRQRLQLTCRTDVVFVRADAGRLQLMLDQLLRFILHCTPDGGCAEIAVRVPEKGDVEFRIGNNGAGLCADELALLFIPFAAADYSLPRHHTFGGAQPITEIDCINGTRRLGTALVRQLAEAHGGTLTIEERTGSRESSFKLSLPAMQV
jgi:signal transduction histidine kinase